MPSWAPGILCRLASAVRRRCQCAASMRAARAARVTAYCSTQSTIRVQKSMRWLGLPGRGKTWLARVDHQTGRHTLLAQRHSATVGLTDRAAHVGPAVQHERRRLTLSTSVYGDMRRAARCAVFQGRAPSSRR